MVDCLTPEQIRQLPDFAKKWQGCAFSTEPANRTEAERAVHRAYANMGFAPPDKIVWCGSPRSGAMARAILMVLAPERIGRNLWSNIWVEGRRQALIAIRKCISLELIGKIREETEWRLANVVLFHSLMDNIERLEVRGRSRRGIWVDEPRSVWTSAWECVFAALETNLGPQVDYHVNASVQEGINQACHGQHDAEWLCFFDYCSEVLGLKHELPTTEGLIGVAQNAGWFWPFQRLCIIAERPLIIKVKERKAASQDWVFHSETEPVISYPDQFQVHAINGVPIAFLKDAASIPVDLVERTLDASLRKIVLERYGVARYITDSGAKEVSRDDFGILYGKIFDDADKWDPMHLMLVKCHAEHPELPDTLYDFYENYSPPSARRVIRNTRADAYEEIQKRRLIGRTVPHDVVISKGRISEFVKRWDRFAFLDQAADRAQTEEGIKAMYRAAYQPPPTKIVWCASPKAALRTRALVLDGLGRWHVAIRLSVDEMPNVTDGFKASEGIDVGDDLQKVVVENMLKIGLESIDECLSSEAREVLESELMDPLYKLAPLMCSLMRRSYMTKKFGLHEFLDLAYCDYAREVLGLKRETERLSGLLEVFQNSGGIIPYQNLCWAIERPSFVRRDEQRRIHCADGPAIGYSDGTKLYAVFGSEVEPYIIEEPEKMTMEEVWEEAPNELKDFLIERYGRERYVKDTKIIV